MNWTLMQNSLLTAGATALLAGAGGFAAALFSAAIGKRTRALLIALILASLVIPPFLSTNTWLYLFGLTGVWRPYIDFDIYSLPGTVFVLSVLFWPVPALFSLAALQRLDKTYLEQEPQLEGAMLLRHLLWPASRRAMFEGMILTFVLALNQFSVPALLQTKVYPAEVWLSFNTKFDFTEALRLSWPLVLAPLLLLALFRFEQTRFVFRSELFPPALLRARLRFWFHSAGLLLAFLLTLSLAVPLGQLLSSHRTWTELFPAMEAGRNAAVHSLLFGIVPALIVVAAGVLLARVRGAMLSWIFFLIPGVVSGIALIWIFNRSPFFAFYQSSGIVLLAFSLRYLAAGWTAARLARNAADPSALDLISTLGGSRWAQFRFAEWPQSRRMLAAGFYLIYLLCLWEVESLILIVPPGQETLALRIFNMLHYGHAAQVDALCVWLLAFALLPLALWALCALCALWNGLPKKSLAAFAILVAAGCGEPSGQTHLQSKIFRSVQVIGTRGTGAGQFNKPRSLALDREDNLYVVDITGRVQKFSPDGKFILSWQMPQTDKGKPKGMALDHEGNIIVVEPHYSRVNHFDPAGKLVAQWGENGTNRGQLAFPRSVAVNSHGEMYLSEYGLAERVQRFSARGSRFIQSFGVPGTGRGELNRAEGLGIDSEDRVFVADSCNHRVEIFSSDGRYLDEFGSPGSAPGQMSYPYDVRLDPEGRRYVCEFGNSRIQIFDARNNPIEILGGAGAEPGMLNNPWAIAFDSRGNLYVADSLNHRVQKFIRREPLPPQHTQNKLLQHSATRPLARK